MIKMLQALRKSKGFTLKELGDMVGVAESTVSLYENDKREPDFETLLKFGEIFDVSVDYLLRGDIYNGQLEKQKQPPTTLTPEQREYLGKYQALYPEGKERVHTTISFEYAKQLGARQIITNITPPDEDNESVIYVDFRYSAYNKASAGTGFQMGDEYLETIRVRIDALPKGYERDQSRYFGVTVSGDSMEPEYRDGDVLIIKDTTVNMGEVGLVIMDGEGYVKKIGAHVLQSLNPDYEDIPMEWDMKFCGKVVGVLDPEVMK